MCFPSPILSHKHSDLSLHCAGVINLMMLYFTSFRGFAILVPFYSSSQLYYSLSFKR
jgi:hypothetical protein